MDHSKMEFKIGEISFSGEGEQKWLTEQFDKLLDKVKELLSNNKITAGNNFTKAAPLNSNAKDDELNPNVFSYDEATKELKVHQTPAEKTNAKKMVQLAIIYLYGMQIIDKARIVTYDDIRTICMAHGCLDATNFAGIFKKQKTLFVITGEGHNKNIKLSHPGLTTAKQLVLQLAAPKDGQ